MRGLQAARGASLTSPEGHPEPEQTPEQETAPEQTPQEQTPQEQAPPEPLPRRAGTLLAVAAVALLLDVATKVYVVAELEGQRVVDLGILRIAVSRNPGAAFSFAEGATVVFTAVAVAVVVVILRTAKRLRSVPWALSLGLLLGGASGNLVDRLFRSPGIGRGAVVDFLDFKVWPVFNVADSAIVCGGVLAVLLSLRGRELDGTRAEKGTLEA